MFVQLSTISPTGSNVALCMGAFFQLDNKTNLKKYYCLQCALAGTTATFNVKLPVEVGLQMHKSVCKALDASKYFLIGVKFTNLTIKTYKFEQGSGYVGYAKNFIILEEKK